MGAASASLSQLEAAKILGVSKMKQNVITVVLIFLHMLSCKKKSEMNNWSSDYIIINNYLTAFKGISQTF